MPSDAPLTNKVVFLMRGLPSCGKSFTARRLAGADGVVCETDEFFYTQVGSDPARYDYHKELLPAARAWNFLRFEQAIAAGRSPIVVDRGNGRNPETRQYAAFAVKHGYRVELREPESPWWQEIRSLLAQKRQNESQLFEWARILASKSAATHRVPVDTIWSWMLGWKPDLQVEEILNVKDP